MQNQLPIAFHSYKLSDAERRYPVGEQELLAVITALRQWQCYLEGAEGGVTVVTDHKLNTYLDSKPAVQLSSRQVRWHEFLSRSHFAWEHDIGSQEFAQIFLCEVFAKHGLPTEVVTDRGTQFTSALHTNYDG